MKVKDFKLQPPRQGNDQNCGFGTQESQMALKLTKNICAKYAQLGKFKVMKVYDFGYSARLLIKVDYLK